MWASCCHVVRYINKYYQYYYNCPSLFDYNWLSSVYRHSESVQCALFLLLFITYFSKSKIKFLYISIAEHLFVIFDVNNDQLNYSEVFFSIFVLCLKGKYRYKETNGEIIWVNFFLNPRLCITTAVTQEMTLPFSRS